MSWRRPLSILVLCLLTSPALAAWQQQQEIPGNGNTLMAVAAGTGENAVAFGQQSQMGSSKPALFVTKDGQTWMPGSVPGDFSFLFTLAMPDDQFVYGGGLGFYQSKDGGSSFQEVKLPGGGGGMFDFITIERVIALDPVHVFAAGGKNVYWTPNSLQWEVTKATVDDVSLGALSFIDPQVGWVAGGKYEEITQTQPGSGEEVVVGYDYKPKGLVLKTTDGGKSFAPMVIGADDFFRHITFINENIGFAVTANNSAEVNVKKTTDGGKTWMAVTLPAPGEGLEWAWLSKIVFVTPLKGWAAGCQAWPDAELDNLGNKAVILRTLDGGMTWEYDPEGERQGAYLDIDFAGEHWGWAVGNWGRIMAYTDGTQWEPQPEDDVVVQPGDDIVGGEEDVMSWGNVFGVFGDDVLITAKSYPNGGNGGIHVGPDDPDCTTRTQSTGCTAAGRGSLGGLLLLVVALLALRLPRRRRVAGRAVATAVALLAVACGGGEETVTVCEEVAPQKLPAAPDTQDDEARAPRAEFRCGLRAEDTAPVFGDTTSRSVTDNDYIVFVKEGQEGGSDLWLATADGKSTLQLTEFNDPTVHVASPAWSPSRTHIAFVSDYRAQYNRKRQNVFVIALDRSVCYQLTPGIEAARQVPTSAATATVTGSFRVGQGAVANPVAGAMVAWPGAEDGVTTGPAGEFSIPVPPGAGFLVLRGTANGQTVKGIVEYAAEPDQVSDVGAVIGAAEPEYDLGRLAWAADSATLFAFVSEQLESLTAVDTNSGEQSLFLPSEEDRVVTFAPFPDAGLALAAWNSEPTAYQVLDLAQGAEPVHTFAFDGQTAASRVTVSPMRFLASIQEERLVLLGADSGGELAAVDATPENLSGLVPGEIDWSTDGARLVFTLAGPEKTNLMVLDVNAGTAAALTTDGRSSQPAWFN